MTDKTQADKTAAELETATATAASEAVKADRERRQTIMALEEAEGREALAETLYMTDLSIDAVKAALAAAPTATTEPQPSQEGYDKQRAAAGSGLAQPGGPRDPKGDRSALTAAVARTNKRR